MGGTLSGLTVLYRGPLASCNYDCPYCPFAKAADSRAVQRADKAALARFVGWCLAGEHQPLSVFFTPWGEALTRPWYRQAVTTLSLLPHVRRVAIQTNLSHDPRWLAGADPARVGLWATWHPGQVALEPFVDRARAALALGVSLSVGIVGLPGHEAQARALRAALPGVYTWVNAVKRDPAAMAADWAAVDPLFSLNAQAWPSLGKACRTGEEVVSVDGDGHVRRCHFVSDVIANLYDGSLARSLTPRACPNATCGCHIGYVHLRELGLDAVYGEGILERVPRTYTSAGPSDGPSQASTVAISQS